MTEGANYSLLKKLVVYLKKKQILFYTINMKFNNVKFYTKSLIMLYDCDIYKKKLNIQGKIFVNSPLHVVRIWSQNF